MNHSQGYEPRVSSKALLKNLAQTALKNVPGAEKLIKKHFHEGPVVDPHRLAPPKPKNQALHLGW